MKKLLLLSLLTSITIQINGQQLSDLKNQHEKLTQESELKRKAKMLSFKNVFQNDSTYFYDDFEDNLERKWIYYNYNSANNYSSFDYFTYENMQWTPTSVRTREFNSDGTISSYLSQIHENGGLINSSKAIYEYNQSGYQTLDDREIWNNDSLQWGPYIRFERTYNADNTLLTLTHYSKNLSGSILELRYIRTHTNVDNVITGWQTEYYSNGVLYNTDKTEVFFNAANDRDSTYTYEWNEDSSTWDLISRYIYPEDINAPVRTYQTDLYQEMTDSWDPRFLHVYSDYTDIGEVQYWDRMRSDIGEPEFYLDSRLEYFWSSNLVDVETPTKNELDIIIANPFEGDPQIIVDGIKENTTFVIYDISGKIMFSRELKESNSFTLNKVLPNGNYIINLIQANEVVGAKKIIKIR